MFMNKPAKRGTHLTWHQDVFRDLDGNPTVTIWMAMDRATTENGCVKIIPGSHRSLLDPESRKAFLPDEKVEPYLKQSGFLTLEAGAGEGFLLHNWMIHGSEINKTDHPRRAFSVCFMDAATKSDKGQEFSIIFGEGALEPDLP
jgi:ectoine hydroxylase-related dioxygenase (phytanoyl-CoA dioxygenase family)